ncbi:unnamed protein product [Amoebophrya sp. A25]|nr:unnamed protein product [Amoebophrya sp. A25]|eukprot:GSA25T00012855001.1
MRLWSTGTSLALLLLGTSTIISVEAVDHSKFRTCAQGSFCRRYRNWVELMKNPDYGYYKWEVVKGAHGDREEHSKKTGSFVLSNTGEKHGTLQLKLTFYKSGGVGFKLTELNPLYPRYEIPAGDVIVAGSNEEMPSEQVQYNEDEGGATEGNPQDGAGAKASIWKWQSKNGDHIEAKLEWSPLVLTVGINGQTYATVNRRNFLNFEIYRSQTVVNKNVFPEHEHADKLIFDSANHRHVDEEGLWAENFHAHRDPKPRGPAALGVDITFNGNVQHVFGLPEHADDLSLKDHGNEPYRLFNLDVFEYELNSPMALYGAVPMMWGYEQSRNTVAGVLWNNPSETFVKIDGHNENQGNTWFGGGKKESMKGFDTWWVSESGIMDVYFFPGPTASAVSNQFHILTGMPAMAPVFSLGKHQCRWNYKSQDDLLEVHDKFESYDIPYDVIWLDIEHTDGKRYFTWDHHHFQDPKMMTDKLTAQGRKLVTIVDPHIKKTDDYSVYTQLRDAKVLTEKRSWAFSEKEIVVKKEGAEEIPQFIKDASVTGPPADYNPQEDGAWEHPLVANPAWQPPRKERTIDYANSEVSTFEGWCWPGQSVYPDFTNPKMRSLWSSNFALSQFPGSTLDTYTWNDMNEPSVFNGPEISAPRDAVHMGDVEHRDVHNLYGMYVHRATFEGHVAHKEGRRPFVLSRSFYTGSHRWGAIWTGDNLAAWSHLTISVPMVLSHALGGISFIGADVGGFFKNPDPELMVRWYQFGAVAYPFFRNHAHIETARREPYLLQKANLLLVKQAIRLRYQILPYYYTLFHQYHTEGTAIIRPLWHDFGSDSKVFLPENLNYELMVGDALLTRVVDKPNQVEWKVYLPGGGDDISGSSAPMWYCWYTFEPLKGGASYAFDVRGNVPLVVKGGSMVPTKFRQRRSAALQKRDPFTLNFFVDPQSGTASGKIYVDDYDSMETPSSLMEARIDVHRKKDEQDTSLLLATLSGKVVKSHRIAELEGVLGATGSGNQGLLVERIVVCGMGSERVHALRQVEVQYAGGEGKVEPLEFRVDLADVVIIKLPKVRVDKDWTIRLTSEETEGWMERVI